MYFLAMLCVSVQLVFVKLGVIGGKDKVWVMSNVTCHFLAINLIENLRKMPLEY